MDLAPVALLTAEEEIRLARRIEAGVCARAVRTGAWSPPRGDGPAASATVSELVELERLGERARQWLLLANLRLITLVTNRVPPSPGLSPDDLFQDGFCALEVAVTRFDHTRGCRFATYALPWIRSAVAGTIADAEPGGGSVTERRHRRRVERAIAELTIAQRRSPTDAELAAALHTSRDWVLRRRRSAPPVSLDDVGIGTVVHPLYEPDAATGDDTDPEIADLMATLPIELSSVIRLRYGFGCPALGYHQLAERLGTSATTVRRLEQRALRLLRRAARSVQDPAA